MITKGLGINWGLQRAFEAADKGRRGKSFRLAGSSGVNREILGAFVTLRDRHRHLVRNNVWASKAVTAIPRHTVGEGIQPAPIGGLTKTKDIKDLWRIWACSTACDWEGRTTFYGLQEQAMRAMVESGEVLIIRRWVMPDEWNPIPLKLQVLESDHLDHTRNEVNDMGVVRAGVQFNKAKQVIGYWVFEDHPGDNIFHTNTTQSEYIPRKDCLHVFETLRPGQFRGLPFGVASFMRQADFSDYEDAQLMKQKLAACFTVFVRNYGESETAPDTDPLLRIEPGVIEYLNDAEGVEFAEPPSVGDYGSYADYVLRGIAAAYGITYELLTGDYSKVNFTSGRMAEIKASVNFRSWQYHTLVPQLCSPVWSWFVDACLLAGKVPERIFSDWTAPRLQQLDPVKETNAQVMRLDNKLTTWSELARENGREPDELFEEIKEDVDRFAAIGIDLYAKNTAKNMTEWQKQ
ncbi:MAG: phage portal protein [Alistipes sp.]|nr:phage portal protein [Alistipes sp.]